MLALSGAACVGGDAPPALALAATQALNGVCLSADPVRSAFRLKEDGTDHINLNLDDYGVFFLEAKDPACTATVASALKSKIESTLNTPFTDAVTRSSQPYGRWLEGGLVSLVFATALELGPRGALDSDLLASLLRVRDSFQFNRDVLNNGCGLVAGSTLGNTCMDDYAVGSTGYAWIAAFEASRGWFTDAATMANSARNLVHAAFGTWDSICIHDESPNPADTYAPRGPCNVKIDSTTSATERQRLNSGLAEAISFNHGPENLGYGIGLLTSIASTANALAFAGQPFSLLDFEQDIARALLREAQAHTDAAGNAFATTGCYDGSLNRTSPCADMGYAPRMFPVGWFLAGYAGAPPVSACPPTSSPPGVYGFNLFAADSDIVGVGLTWGRVAIYLHLGNFWSGAAASCGITRPPLGASVVKLPHACLADPPAGPGNSNANNAGTYDYYCGYYKYNYGSDFGYCSQATQYARATGLTTAATGSCQATADGSPGALWAYQAGYYDYLCRYYEYLGYGSDYQGYCFWSSYYAARGRCTGCDSCTPSCAGKTCGASDGCGGTCVPGSGCIKECAAQPQVGPGNGTAMNAGLYDYYCGYYLAYNNGNDLGYCQLANQNAAAAGIHTTGTGVCAAGASYNYQAGLYDYYCRYYEYAGYGWDYNGYCTQADAWVTAGNCSRCGQCRPTCTGKSCGAGDGCGGICYSGSGCCTASCSGKTCGDSDGCFGTCQAGSGCTSAGPLQSYPPKGWVDGYNTQHIWGWACDPDYPDQGNRVDFYTMDWRGLGSVGAYLSSSAAIAAECRGGASHYFDFWPAGGLPSGTHFMAWSIDLPYATAGNDNRAIGGQGSIGNGTEFVIP